jgi:glycosyltransferase involved in cell wall biosynthesis
MSAGLFISWAPFSRRTETLARVFDLEPAFVSTPWPKRPWTTPVKYPWQGARTMRELSRSRPREVWVMDPPSLLPALAGAWARQRGVPLVADLHTVAFSAPEWRLLRPLELPALRHAAAVLVTNEELAGEVRGWGARAVVLPDPAPEPPAETAGVEVDDGLVTVVATYSKDEPLELLPGLARALPEVRFAVTGAPRGQVDGWPANLTATGFLSDADYWRQLARSALVMVLTTRPATLLSGGYEAMALGRPLLVSDHAVLRTYFGDAAVYAEAAVESLAAGVAAGLERGGELAGAIEALHGHRGREWERAAGRLRALLGRAP